MSNPISYCFELPEAIKPEFIPLNEEVHPEFFWLTEKRSRSRTRDVFKVIDTVVIHATAGFATQHAIDTWKQRTASAHWIIPDENEPQHGHFVWATVAEAKAAYHVRDSVQYQDLLGAGVNVNNRSLGIEIVNTQNVEAFTDPYSDWQLAMVARIVLYAWAKYPNLKHVIAHACLDPTRRSDPGSNFPWDKFKQMVLNHAVSIERNSLVNQDYTPPERQVFIGNCCEP